ncbi:triacylglycerol lipase [Nocardioides sp. R-C-SC26]|uniref:esterase/lipase family protein n=1 Tax=Nocardioides sp. R-C-SC26 TaxID=2870414 RepID=UPI001E5E750B|nr:hypothetical protein [Nocardioides sp. R-C-SC26]
MTTTLPAPSGPSVLDALSLLAEVGDQLVVGSARDTHRAWSRRVHRMTRRLVGPAAAAPEAIHRGISEAVYGGLGLGLRGASTGLDLAASRGWSAPLEATPRGRFVSSAVNGLIGDKLLRERPQMAIPTAVRAGGRDVELDAAGLRRAFPDASPRLVIFLHGLCENESYWQHHRERTGTTYPDAVAELGWTPVLLRTNTGLSLRENGVALHAVVQRVVDSWPVPVERIALVGHSMGGLILRAAGAVAAQAPDGARDWNELVTDVVTLGTPHRGAPIAWGIGHGSRGLAVLPETAAFGRILDWRSIGVHDLVVGLDEDVAPLPHARYRLVAATLTTSPRHPVGHVVGDLLVRPPSAHGRRAGRDLFPGADLVHVGRTDHFGLLNHPEVHTRLGEWLS